MRRFRRTLNGRNAPALGSMTLRSRSRHVGSVFSAHAALMDDIIDRLLSIARASPGRLRDAVNWNVDLSQVAIFVEQLDR